MRKFRPTPVGVIASLALAIALSGTSFAAANLINGSQIRPHTIAKNRLTAAAISGLRGNRGPRGFQGPQGAQGVQGVQGFAGTPGPAGPAGIANIGTVSGPASAQCASGGGACQIAQSDATCPAGTVVVGGGFISGSIENITLFAARTSASTYGVIAENDFTGTNTIQAQAICAAGPGVSAAGAVSSAEALATTLAHAKQEVTR